MSFAKLWVVSDDQQSRVHRRRRRETRYADRVALFASVESRARELASKLGDDLAKAKDVSRRNVFAARDNQLGLAREGRRVPKPERARRSREFARVLRGPAASGVSQRFDASAAVAVSSAETCRRMSACARSQIACTPCRTGSCFMEEPRCV